MDRKLFPQFVPQCKEEPIVKEDVPGGLSDAPQREERRTFTTKQPDPNCDFKSEAENVPTNSSGEE